MHSIDASAGFGHLQRNAHPRARRGSFAAIYGVGAFAFVGLAALAIDVTLVRLARSEVQAIADTAAHTALLRLRATDDRVHAAAVARSVINRNRVVGSPALVESLAFGTWSDGSFVEDAQNANSVRVVVSANPALTFGTLWTSSVGVRGAATAAARPLHTLVVVDITNSWSPLDFESARAGAVEVFDQLTATSGPDDRIGMVLFMNKYGIEQTPLLPARDAELAGVREEWGNLRTASKAGVSYGRNCSTYAWNQRNDFDYPLGGCYPHMWREYRDEYGTDHAVGIEYARRLFEERPDPSVYRAMIILTDGQPAGVGNANDRDTIGYTDTRWRYLKVTDQRSAAEVQTAAVESAQTAWRTNEVNTWIVSYKSNGSWMNQVPQGDGSFLLVQNKNDLVPIFADIAESLPTMLVQ